MDEFQIARGLAGVLHQRSYSGQTSPTEEMEKTVKLNNMTGRLAMSRAVKTGRNFPEVMRETEMVIMVEVGNILEATVMKGLMVAVIGGCEEVVCGVREEGMKRGSMHRDYCMYMRLKERSVCPLCRFYAQI